jgi:hypothetical protein
MQPKPELHCKCYSTYMDKQARVAFGRGPRSKLEETKPCSGLGFEVLKLQQSRLLQNGQKTVLLHWRHTAVQGQNAALLHAPYRYCQLYVGLKGEMMLI